MAFKALIRVGDYSFPDPSEYKGNTFTIVDSSRNVAGHMVGDVIRDDVAKVEVSWKFLTVEQWANINKCFKNSAGGSFVNEVEFFDQSAGEFIIRQMYVGDRNAGVFRRDPVTGEILGWLGCKLNLIEV